MSKLVPFNIDDADRPEAFDAERPEDKLPEIGEWYWVKHVVRYTGEWTDDKFEAETGRVLETELAEGDVVEWLGCIDTVGSNYVRVRAPTYDRSYRHERVHFNDLAECLRFEPDADRIIAENTTKYQQHVKLLLGEVQEVTKRLGVVPHSEIADQSGGGDNSLAVLSAQVDTEAYKTALIKAKDTDLPALFKMVETANKRLAKWMGAPTLPTEALMGPMKDGIKQIEDRIYTIELYAGLTEDAVKVADGDPAKTHEPLRIMQRRCYMDEECLLDYDAGGMELKNVTDFDEWISRPQNRDRLLPYQRTLTAFRVRRTDKEREDGGNMLALFINSQIKEADKTTFLYIRNGEQVWRVNCDFVFDEMIIPNRDEFDPTGEMMFHMSSTIKNFMPKARFESLSAAYEKHEAWMKEWVRKPNPAKGPNHHFYSGDSPFYEELGGFSPSGWRPFNDSDVYYDDASDAISDEMRRYNRIATIVQGLFDRSLVLHPHPPVQMWNPDSFARSIEMIYDGQTLTYGDKPDFEAYRAKLNASMGPDSIVTGQEEFWMRFEADRENKRQENNWRDRHRQSHYTRLRPYGNPGPGLVARMDDWRPRAKKAVFRWNIESESWRSRHNTKPKVVEVPVEEMLNVSAYKAGDYKQFFNDPRTRQEYLRWAPLMLAAEDYLAGKLPLGRPGNAKNDWER